MIFFHLSFLTQTGAVCTIKSEEKLLLYNMPVILSPVSSWYTNGVGPSWFQPSRPPVFSHSTWLVSLMQNVNDIIQRQGDKVLRRENVDRTLMKDLLKRQMEFFRHVSRKE